MNTNPPKSKASQLLGRPLPTPCKTRTAELLQHLVRQNYAGMRRGQAVLILPAGHRIH